MNVCSYHLQEAGATPVREIVHALATAIGVLDAVQESGQVPAERFPAVFASISFFVNAGIRFVEETCKMRAFVDLWERIGQERYGVTDEKALRVPLRRAGQQPRTHGGAAREQRAADRPRSARRHAVAQGQGPLAAAAGVERGPRLAPPVGPAVEPAHQQVLAYETDLLEYPDLLDGSHVVEARTAALAEEAWAGSRTSSPSVVRSRPSTSSRAGWSAATPSACADRERRAGRGRRQPVHGDRAEPPRRRGVDLEGRPRRATGTGR